MGERERLSRAGGICQCARTRAIVRVFARAREGGLPDQTAPTAQRVARRSCSTPETHADTTTTPAHTIACFRATTRRPSARIDGRWATARAHTRFVVRVQSILANFFVFLDASTCWRESRGRVHSLYKTACFYVKK